MSLETVLIKQERQWEYEENDETLVHVKIEREWGCSEVEEHVRVKKDSEGCSSESQTLVKEERELVPSLTAAEVGHEVKIELELSPAGPQLQDIAFVLRDSKTSLKQEKAETVLKEPGGAACHKLEDSLDFNQEHLVLRARTITLKGDSDNTKHKGFNKKSTLKRRSRSPIKTKLKSHQTRTAERSFICDFCGKQFAIKKNFVVHIRIHMGVKRYFCKTCNKECANNYNLKRHERSHTNVNHTNENPYSCELCKKWFVDQYSLTRHKRTHTGEKPYSCDICSKKFTIVYNLKVHRQKHISPQDNKDTERVTCQICNKQLHKSSLPCHMKIHSGNKPFSCEICSMQFLTVSNFTRHKRVHTGEKPYSCEICKKSFSEMRSVIKHKQTHAVGYKRTRRDKRTYICTICNKQFKKNQSLQMHCRVHTGDQPFSCNICQKPFANPSNLKRHYLVHTGEKPYACKFCTKRYTDLRYLMKHEQIHTDETP